jgi:CBS domain-containing protein
MLTAEITRRSGTFWQERPQALAALRTFQLADFIEAPPRPLLPPTTTLRELTRAFADSATDVFYVVSADERLEGLVTLTDLLRAQGANHRPDTPIAEFMTRRPASLLATDTALIAASAFREHNFKALPVVADRESLRVVGLVRARKLIARLLQALPS